jgi:hypothetical protein
MTAPALALAEARDLMGGRFGTVDAPCPLCGPYRQTAVNQRRKTLRLWCSDPEFISFHCARCEQRGWASASRNPRPSVRSVDALKILADIQRRDNDETRERLEKALELWRRRRPIVRTVAETYLREVRGYRGLLPATLGYLAPSTGFPPAMIAAFGMATETLPGEMVIDDAAVRGVHLTRLKPDGSGKAGTDRDKIMIGKSLGAPIVLAPVNDGLGLAIAEGIEDALSIHDASGLGAWAAGAASRMPALADRIPSYVECVTVVADADAMGRANAQKLAAAIPLPTRDVRLIIPPQIQKAAA